MIPKGSTKLKQAGKKGEKTYVYRERIVDGEVVETVLVSETVTKKPVNAVKLVGTVVGTPLSKAPFDIELDEAGQPVNYKQVFTGTCTAYTCDGGRLSGVTATGMKPQVGVVARQSQEDPLRLQAVYHVGGRLLCLRLRHRGRYRRRRDEGNADRGSVYGYL